MKKIIYTIITLVILAQTTHAQNKGMFRAGIDIGYTIPDGGGGGLLIALEAKQNITNDMNVGVRYENTVMIKEVYMDNDIVEAEFTANIAFIGTFDHYFNKNRTMFSPFIGGGIGYNILGNAQFDTVNESGGAKLTNKVGGIARAGFEVGKLRLCTAYNLIGKSNLGEGVEVKNSYIGISLGFYIGGGKWNK